MNIFQIFAAVIGIMGVVTGAAGIVRMVIHAQRMSCCLEKAKPKQSPGLGVFYSFTAGMAPWSKESIRIHWRAYFRGIIFHICIFLGIAWIIASPWAGLIPWVARLIVGIILGIGVLMGLAGYAVRLEDERLRFLSTPDDYFAIGIVSLLLAAGAISAFFIELVPVLWIITGLTAAYVPYGKLRHMVYFFFSRYFLGVSYGSRGALEL
jgi:hypothetical protein